MSVPVTYQSLIERIMRHMNNGFPNDSVSYTDNEMLLYIQQAIAANLVGQVYAGAKITGNIEVPEGYMTTYELSALTQDSVTKDWYTTLPQPPISLPLGYSISNVYFANETNGRGVPVVPIKTKRVAYRDSMPLQFGARYWVEGSQIRFAMSDGSPLLNQTAYVTMASTRTTDKNAVLNLPDDAIEMVFNKVVALMIQRIQQNKDIISDGLPAGNKTS